MEIVLLLLLLLLSIYLCIYSIIIYLAVTYKNFQCGGVYIFNCRGVLNKIKYKIKEYIYIFNVHFSAFTYFMFCYIDYKSARYPRDLR